MHELLANRLYEWAKDSPNLFLGYTEVEGQEIKKSEPPGYGSEV